MSDNANEEGQDFDLFLANLSIDAEEAAREYERLRGRLAKFFEARGSSDVEMLADETLTRVVGKVRTFDPGRGVKFNSFIYGFAINVFREERKKRNALVPIDGYDVALDRSMMTEEEMLRFSALETCLGKMPRVERELLLDYYTDNGSKQHDRRGELAAAIGCSVTTLHTRICRLRQKLAGCVKSRLVQ